LSQQSQRWVALARVLRPRGNKGEVAAEILTDFPKRLTQLTEVFLGGTNRPPSNAEPVRARLKSVWLNHNDRRQVVFHFEGYDSISDAEKLRGFEIWIPFEQRATLASGQYFVSELIGCSVFERPTQSSPVASSPCAMAVVPIFIGKVTDVLFTGEGVAGTPVLVVGTEKGELLLPLAEDICPQIDTATHRIEVVLPEGLRDLNSPL
jgi:16S rRNA processing protein RimM